MENVGRRTWITKVTQHRRWICLWRLTAAIQQSGPVFSGAVGGDNTQSHKVSRKTGEILCQYGVRSTVGSGCTEGTREDLRRRVLAQLVGNILYVQEAVFPNIRSVAA